MTYQPGDGDRALDWARDARKRAKQAQTDADDAQDRSAEFQAEAEASQERASDLRRRRSPNRTS